MHASADVMGARHKLAVRRRYVMIFTIGAILALLLLAPSLMRGCPVAEQHAAARAQRNSLGALNTPVPPQWAAATHLIMVAGHAVYTGAAHTRANVESEDSWFLEPFQHGQLATMLNHIKRGVELAGADNSSLLIFSGGETRAAAGPRSEAASYWEAADALGWFGQPHVRSRTVLEVHARDSLENLLFALCRHREVSGRYPTRVTVISFGFKRRRFVELHRAALRLPRSRFRYVGIDPPGIGVDVLHGEVAHSSKPFERDPYGCAEAQLRAKRATRNPFRRHIGYADGCPEITQLLEHCGTLRYDGPLPWSSKLGDDDDEGTPAASKAAATDFK